MVNPIELGPFMLIKPAQQQVDLISFLADTVSIASSYQTPANTYSASEAFSQTLAHEVGRSMG
jgi:hypothetical protein